MGRLSLNTTNPLLYLRLDCPSQAWSFLLGVSGLCNSFRLTSETSLIGFSQNGPSSCFEFQSNLVELDADSYWGLDKGAHDIDIFIKVCFMNLRHPVNESLVNLARGLSKLLFL